MSQKVLVSRCLLGHRVRYDGGASGPYPQLTKWQAEGRVIALCPEVAGGLPTPRAAAEIPGGQGTQVLSGNVPVTSTQAELLAFRDAESKAMSDLIKAANIKLE